MTTVELPVIDETALDADHDHVLVHLYYKWNQLMAVCGVSVLTTSTKAASTVGFVDEGDAGLPWVWNPGLHELCTDRKLKGEQHGIDVERRERR